METTLNEERRQIEDNLDRGSCQAHVAAIRRAGSTRMDGQEELETGTRKTAKNTINPMLWWWVKSIGFNMKVGYVRLKVNDRQSFRGSKRRSLEYIVDRMQIYGQEVEKMNSFEYWDKKLPLLKWSKLGVKQRVRLGSVANGNVRYILKSNLALELNV